MDVTVNGQIIGNVPQVVVPEDRLGQEHAVNQRLNTAAETAQCLGQRLNNASAFLRCVLLMVTIATGVHLVLALKVAVWGRKQERENVIILSQLAKAEIALTWAHQLTTSRATHRPVQLAEVTPSGLSLAHVRNLVQVGHTSGHATVQILNPRRVVKIVLV